jgi:CxxC motif-containing protein (DUF1111 family)
MEKKVVLIAGLVSAAIAGVFAQTEVTTFAATAATPLPPGTGAKDPGVRYGPAGAGSPIAGLSRAELALFNAGSDEFAEVETVPDGLGPTMNLDSCAGCHMQPSVGGSSPAVNPQFAFANAYGARNTIPAFIRSGGPVLEARFVRNPDGTPDGGVHDLFTISGRHDAPNCAMAQPDFAGAAGRGNVIFRIPTPVFGGGLIESIPDDTILDNRNANVQQKTALGIRGRPNIVLTGNTVSGQPNANGNDGTLARFGWKAQNKSLLLFAGEAYNVEMGITNELFQTERSEYPSCQFAMTPNDVTNAKATTPIDALSGIEKFALFMRFLAPPTPSANTPGGADSITAGRNLFTRVGCSLCHTPAMKTGNSSVAALRNQWVNLYSDLLVHDMGPELADGVSQGQAGPSEFRTAPLWGLGQRIFFLHDGRTSDLEAAIAAHQSGSARNRDASEANAVVDAFNTLPETSKQNLLNFLRSL